MSAVTQVWLTLEGILDLLDGTTPSVCALDPLPCRAAVYPGEEVPWDTCGESCGDGTNGQLWAVLTGITVDTQGAGACSRITWTADVGILRCASMMSDAGGLPSVGAVQADSWFQAADADQIRRALLCCPDAPADLRNALEDLAFVAWQPLGPSGGCVGGMWTIRGVLQDCCEDVPPAPPGVDRAACA